MRSVGDGFPDRHPDPEVLMIDVSLLNRVRATLATMSRPRASTTLRGMASRPLPPPTVEPRVVGPRTVLAVTGEIDLATAPRLREAVAAAFAAGACELCIDLAETTFMDSSGLHVLLDAAQQAEELDRELTIACPPGPVRRVIEIAGLGTEIPVSSPV
jgi:anti-sigma B factor antagonist